MNFPRSDTPQNDKQLQTIISLTQILRKLNRYSTWEGNFQQIFQQTAASLVNKVKGVTALCIVLSREKEIFQLAYPGNYRDVTWEQIPREDLLPKCAKENVSLHTQRIISKASKYCKGCIYWQNLPTTQLLVTPIRGKDLNSENTRGLLLVFWKQKYEINETELELLKDIGEDLGFTYTKVKEHEAKKIGYAQAKLDAEEKILKTEEKFQHLFEGTPDATLFMNENGRITEVNEAACKIFNANKSELLGLSLTDIPALTQAAQRKFGENVQQKVEDGREETSLYLLKSEEETDQERYLEMNSTSCEKFGGQTGVIKILRDITKRKKTEEKLEMLHKWAQRLNKVKEIEDITTYTLDALEEILDFEYTTFLLKDEDTFEVKDYRGYNSSPSVRLDVPKEHGLVVKAANKRGSINLKDVRQYSTYHPSQKPIKSQLVAPIRSEDQTMGFIIVESEKIDRFNPEDKHLLEILISHVGVAIKELQEKQQRVSLQKLDKLRNKFIAMVTHELGTPLTSTTNELEMLNRGYRGDLTRRQQNAVKRSLEEIKRLTRLIKDFRRISKLRTGRIELDKGKFRLIHTIEKALKRYINIIGKEGITVVKEFQTPGVAIYDEDRIIQVVQNLVKNAIDFTENRITIKAWHTEDHVKFSVSDNGVGIPEKTQEEIFEPFYGLEEKSKTGERHFGGTGLGLHICKRIVKCHGGTIQATSTSGKGSTFTVTLPKDQSKENLP